MRIETDDISRSQSVGHYRIKCGIIDVLDSRRNYSVRMCVYKLIRKDTPRMSTLKEGVSRKLEDEEVEYNLPREE